MNNFTGYFPDFIYDNIRQIYYNPHTRKMFSQSYIFEHSYEDIKQAVQEESAKEGWQFYFNRDPSPELQSSLLELIGA